MGAGLFLRFPQLYRVIEQLTDCWRALLDPPRKELDASNVRKTRWSFTYNFEPVASDARVCSQGVVRRFRLVQEGPDTLCAVFARFAHCLCVLPV